MNTSEILKKVRKIEIKTKGISNHIFSGEYNTAFKGKGMVFSEVREYQPGDDIRLIDWNVTARYNNPYVKIFEEEREMTVMLLIDVSGSANFGTQNNLKKEIITEISSVLSFSAINNNDKVGVIFFSDKIEKFIPPKKGKSHILRIIRELITFNSENKNTNIGKAIEYFNKVNKKRSVCFILSDFIGNNFEKSLKIVNNKHDVIALIVKDLREKEIVDIGLVKIENPENGFIRWIDTSSKKLREEFKNNSTKFDQKIQNQLKQSGVDFVNIDTNKDYIKPLINFFKRRSRK
tara:strand:- start:3370 stop:4242 length:873 start_codon:yes stop_codon:yes gene_type:complete